MILNRKLQVRQLLLPWGSCNGSEQRGQVAAIGTVSLLTSILILKSCVTKTPRTEVPPRIEDATAKRSKISDSFSVSEIQANAKQSAKARLPKHDAAISKRLIR